MTDLFTERDKKKAKAFIKGANTGIANLLGFPVDMVNYAPVLLNLLPGEQGMKPFSENPVGGSQMFKDLMAECNVGTYKDLESIPKDEYAAGVTGMLSSEALLSLVPASKLVQQLTKRKKVNLPQPSAGGVDLSRRGFLKAAPVAVAATTMVPPVLKNVGDVISTPGVAKVGKTVLPSSAIIAKSRVLASQISDGMIESLFKKTKKAEKLSTKQLDLKTAEYNKTLSDFLKGKKYEDLIKLSKNDLADLYNQKNFSAHKGAGDPLRSKEYGPLLDKVFKDRGIGLDSQGNYKKLLRNEGDPPPKNYLEGGNFDELMTIFERRDKRMLPSSGDTVKTTTKQDIDTLFEAMDEEGALLEFPELGKKLNRYTFNNDRDALIEAITDEDYPAYEAAMKGMLKRTFPSGKIPVRRVENYTELQLFGTKDPETLALMEQAGLQKLKDQKKIVTEKLIDIDDVKFVGNPAEEELIILDTPREFRKGAMIGDKQLLSYTINLPKKVENLLGGDKPQRFYHGTRSDFKEFNPEAEFTFVADDPETAAYYAGASKSTRDLSIDIGSNIRPVYLKDVNFFDVDNPKHIKMLKESEFYKSDKKNLDLFGKYDSLSGDPKNQKNFINSVEAGNYDTIENSGLIKWIKSQGFDGFTTYEQEGKNYAVFDTKNIVPGVEKKAEGGIAGLSDVARDMFKGPKGIGAYQPFMVG